MTSEETRNIDNAQLLYEYHRLDGELEIVRCLGEELKKHGRHASAEYLDEAKQHLMYAIFSIKNGLKCIDTVGNYEQIKIDLDNC